MSKVLIVKPRKLIKLEELEGLHRILTSQKEAGNIITIPYDIDYEVVEITDIITISGETRKRL